MEDREFDQFVRERANAPTRRSLVQGLAAVLGAAGVGIGLGLDAGADKSKKKKRKQEQKRKQKKKEKNQECNDNGKVCATPTNPCLAVSCESNTCVTSNVANGTACGGGQTCTNGTCSCPDGKTCDVQVGPGSMNDWFGYNDETDEKDDSLLEFVTGLGNPPYGSGSVQMTVTGQQRRNIATYQFAGVKLADISQLKFTTYNASATNNQGPNASGYLHFNVDFNGTDTWQRRLVFVPQSNGSVKEDKWQEWDAIGNGDALWVLSGGLWPDDNLPSDTEKTWDAILAQYPQVRIRVTDAFLGIRVGEPYPDGFTGNVGSVTFGSGNASTRFVFGPTS